MKPRVTFVQRSNGVLVSVVMTLSQLEKSIGFTFRTLPVTDPVVLIASKSKTVLGMNSPAMALFNVSHGGHCGQRQLIHVCWRDAGNLHSIFHMPIGLNFMFVVALPHEFQLAPEADFSAVETKFTAVPRDELSQLLSSGLSLLSRNDSSTNGSSASHTTVSQSRHQSVVRSQVSSCRQSFNLKGLEWI